MSASTRTRTGIGGWNYPPWRGTFYPAALAQAQELAFASRQLGSIEINGTFYRMQKADTFRRWAAETPQDFVFSVNAHRLTTHRKLLAEAKASIDFFLASGITALGEKLGPILWQFAPTKRFEAEDFEAFLTALPAERDNLRLRHVVEVRHESFCSEEVIALLRRHNIAVCYTDSPKFPNIADICADFVYARLQRCSVSYKAGYPPRELDRWVERIQLWEKGGAPTDLPYISGAQGDRPAGRDCFVYLIDGAKEKAPAAAIALAARLVAHRAPGE